MARLLRAIATTGSLALFFGAVVASNDGQICLGSKLPPTNGQQLAGGSCADTPLGQIPSVDNMISTLITEPANGAQVQAGSPVEFKIQIINLETGHFDDPPTEVYYARPQTLNANGIIQGHAHLTCQQIVDPQTPPDPSAGSLQFFLGLNQVAQNNILTQVVPQFTAKGQVRCCVMIGSSGHQPPVMPVAQRGSVDDCIRIEVV